MKYRKPYLRAFLLATLLAGCGGSNTPTVNNGIGQNDTPTGPTINDESAIESTLFPPEGPVIDPASTREEIASRADAFLVEYRTFMSGLIPQMNEVYQTVSSGLASSDIPNVLASDIKFVNAINDSCEPLFDNAGALIGISDCFPESPKFALRHQLYANVQIFVNDYDPTADFALGDETEIHITEGRYALGGGFVTEEALNIDTGKYTVSTVAERNPPMVSLGFPAFSLDRKNCRMILSPTRLPEDSLEVNRCSEMYKDMLLVLQRLNSSDLVN